MISRAPFTTPAALPVYTQHLFDNLAARVPGPVTAQSGPSPSSDIFVPAIGDGQGIQAARPSPMLAPAVRLHAPSEPQADEGATKAAKSSLGTIKESEHPITSYTQVYSLYRAMYDWRGRLGHQGDLDKGLVVFPVDEEGKIIANGHLVYMRGSELLPKNYVIEDGTIRVNSVVFGRQPGVEHVEYSWAASGDVELDEALLQTWDALLRGESMRDLQKIIQGLIGVGHEWEVWCVGDDGTLRPAVHTDELQTHLFETSKESPGPLFDPLVTTRAIAQEFLNFFKPQHTQPGTLLVPLGADPSSSMLDFRMNNEAGGSGPYVTAIAQRFAKTVKIRTPEEAFLWGQVARAHGYDDIEKFFDSLLSRSMAFSAAASHVNIGSGTLPHTFGVIPGYKADLGFMIAQANIFSSSLGTLLQMLSSTGPFVSGAAIMGHDGNPVWRARNVTGTVMGTAARPNHPIASVEDLTKVMIDNLTQGDQAADRLARASLAVTEIQEDGSKKVVQYIAHGDVRIRLEWSVEDQGGMKKGIPAMRVEYTGADSTNIANKIRLQTVLQMLSMVALQARVERDDHDVLEQVVQLLADGTNTSDLYGHNGTISADYMYHGPDAPSVRFVQAKMRKLLERIPEIPALRQIKEIALRSIDIVSEPGDMQRLAEGKCTIAAAMVDLANNGYNGRQAAVIMGHFAMQETLWLLDGNRTEAEIRSYLLGEDGAGFEFQWPNTAALADDVVAA